jgi:Tfp pilus assembly protein PilZ
LEDKGGVMKSFDINSLINDEERREETRLNRSAVLYVETVSSAPDSNDGPIVVACKTVDFSANGIQVEMNEELTAGAIHQMALDLPNSKERFQLTGEVRWVRPLSVNNASGEVYVAGIMLFDSEGTEIIDWKLAIANWLKD